MSASETLTVVAAARVRHWRAGNHSPYPGKLHDPATDKEIDWHEEIWRALQELPEGARVSISIAAQCPAPGEVAEDDYWTLLSPHTYGHLPPDLGSGEAGGLPPAEVIR